MGIKGLCQFLRKRDASLFVNVPLSKFGGSRFAVDASVYLYKFISMDNKQKGKWIDMFISFILWIRKNNIRPIFIFDGTPPPQKERTQQERRAVRHRTEQRVLEIEQLLEAITETDPNEFLSKDIQTRINTIVCENTEYYPRNETTLLLEELYKKENSKVIKVGSEQINKIQKLLTGMGLPWFQAITEAEKTCVWLCKWGYVSGVVTADSDVLAYGVDIFIKDLQTNSNTCQVLKYNDILNSLNFTPEQFTDFCIMCGTDYNQNIPGIGPAKAYKLLIEYGCLDSISEGTVDTDSLYYKEGRMLFTLPEKHQASLVIKGINSNKAFKIPFIKEPNKGLLDELLFKTNSRFSSGEIMNTRYQPQFIIKK